MSDQIAPSDQRSSNTSSFEVVDDFSSLLISSPANSLEGEAEPDVETQSVRHSVTRYLTEHLMLTASIQSTGPWPQAVHLYYVSSWEEAQRIQLCGLMSVSDGSLGTGKLNALIVMLTLRQISGDAPT